MGVKMWLPRGVRNRFDKSDAKNRDLCYVCNAMPQLTNRRHEIFALELASGAPLVSAFLVAGYKESYSAPYNASRLRNTPKVRERINELLQEHGERSRIKVEWVQEQIAPLLEIDPGELYESTDPNDPDKLKLKPLSSLPARVRKAITRIRIDPETNHAVEIFLSDKIAAANALLRSLPGGSVDENIALQFTRIERLIVPALASSVQSAVAPPAPAQIAAKAEAGKRLFERLVDVDR
jgi:phage terminase small subunit